VTSIVVLGDLALGGHLARTSPISYLIAEGSRFYGIGNELMGVAVGSLLVATASEGSAATRSTRTVAALALTTAVYLMAAPRFGAKFGSILVAVPAFGVVAARAGGRRLTVHVAAALEAAAAALTGLVFFADRLRPVTERSHIGSGLAAGTAERKLSAALRLLAFSIWMIALLVFLAEAALVARARTEDVRRLLRADPFLKAALQGAVLAVAGALVFNDAGVIAATFIVVQLVAFAFSRLATAGVTGSTPAS
jgi:hypothetical protein